MQKAGSNLFKLVSKLGVAAGVLLATLFTAEAVLRLLAVERNPKKEAAAQIPWNTASVRLLVVGDSFIMEGHGVDRLLKKSLAAQGVSVQNTAYSGYGPSDYLEIVKTQGAASKPSLILLGFYAGNDLVDRKPNKSGKAGYLKSTELFKRFRALRSRWMSRQLIEKSSAEWIKAGVDPAWIKKAKEGRFNAWAIDLAVRQPSRQLDSLLIEKPYYQGVWLKVREQLREVQELAHGMGARLVIVIFPHTFQVNRNHFDLLAGLGYTVSERTLTEQRPQELLKEFCQDQQIECLDLLPAFRANRAEALFWPEDEHLNNAGNRLAAENIVQFLKEKTELI